MGRTGFNKFIGDYDTLHPFLRLISYGCYTREALGQGTCRDGARTLLRPAVRQWVTAHGEVGATFSKESPCMDANTAKKG